MFVKACIDAMDVGKLCSRRWRLSFSQPVATKTASFLLIVRAKVPVIETTAKNMLNVTDVNNLQSCFIVLFPVVFCKIHTVMVGEFIPFYYSESKKVVTQLCFSCRQFMQTL